MGGVAVLPLSIFLHTLRGEKQVFTLQISTALAVCHTRCHYVFNRTSREKTSMGWFYRLKLDLVINHKGHIMGCQNDGKGYTHDCTPLDALSKRLTGKILADKGLYRQKSKASGTVGYTSSPGSVKYEKRSHAPHA